MELNSESLDSQKMSNEDVLEQKYPGIYNKLQKEKHGYNISESKRKMYLFSYNLFMSCSFLYVFIIMVTKYAKFGEEYFAQHYNTVGDVVKFTHLIMLLEVLHPLFGYTKGSPLEALLLVGGRNLVILALIDAEPRMQPKPVVTYLFIAYATIEIVRYPYYMLRVYDIELDLLTWLRYTLWIPLFPTGFICEGVIILRSIPYLEETERFSILLPNSWNISFYFPNFLRFSLLFVFFPVLYALMNHMYHLRCKRLNIRQHPNNKKQKGD